MKRQAAEARRRRLSPRKRTEIQQGLGFTDSNFLLADHQSRYVPAVRELYHSRPTTGQVFSRIDLQASLTGIATAAGSV